MAHSTLKTLEEIDPYNIEETNDLEADMDSMHVLPLSIIPLKTPALRRARLIKNVRLESVIELFNYRDGGSGQIETTDISNMFGWAKDKKHVDEGIIAALSKLHSFDVYSLRIQLRKLGIQVDQSDRLKLSDSKRADLMQFMNVFTKPLLLHVYNSPTSQVDSMEQLIQKFASPEKGEALENLTLMANKLKIEIQEVPKFLEEYADIYLSIAYGKETLNSLIPQILMFEDSIEEMKENYELRSDARLMRSIEFIQDSLTDVTASVVSRFEAFDRSSQSMWDDITAESFNRLKSHIRAHHVSIGAILCGLSVKMTGWQNNFAAGFGLVRRADFIRSDMMQGMEKIIQIEEIIKREQKSAPTWESFTIPKAQ